MSESRTIDFPMSGDSFVHFAPSPALPGSLPKSSVVFWSGLVAAAIPLSLAAYWIAVWFGVESAGTLLRALVFAGSLLLAFIFYRASLSHAEVNLFHALTIAAVLWLISALTATHPSQALVGWLKTLMLYAVCCLLTRGLRNTYTSRVFGFALLAGGLILTAFIAYTYVRFLGFTLPTYKVVREFKGIQEAAEVSLNSIAFAAAFSFVAGLCLVWTNWLLTFTGLVVIVISSVLSGSRAPLVILVATVFLLLLIYGLRSKSLLLWVATALVAGVAMVGGVAVFMLASDQDLSHATEGRWHLWSVGLQKFSERPLFGYGYESWRDDLVSRLPGETDLTFDLAKRLGGGYHNEYVTVMAEEGLIGLTAVVLIISLLVRSSWLLAFRPWGVVHTGQWPLFASLFLLLRANFESPGLFGYGQDPADYLAYILVAIVLSRFSIEEDWALSTNAQRAGAL